MNTYWISLPCDLLSSLASFQCSLLHHLHLSSDLGLSKYVNQHSHLNLSRNVRLSVLYDLDFNTHDPLDASAPHFDQFVKSQSGEDEDNPIHMANIDIPNLLGRSFLLPSEDNGERHMAKIIDIDDHGQPLEDIKLKLKINKDQAEEIM